MNLYDFKVEMNVTVPAHSEEKAENTLRAWETNTQDAIGGLSFLIKKSQMVAELEPDNDYNSNTEGEKQ